MSIIFMKELLLYFGLRLVIGKGRNLLIPLNYVNSVLIIIEKKEQWFGQILKGDGFFGKFP